MNTKSSHSSAEAFLKELVGGPLTMGMILSARRKSEYKTLQQFAKILGVSKAHLCDIEKGRRLVSPKRAVRFAKKIGNSATHFVQVAINDLLRKEGLKYHVELKESA
jgi:transcriptional regulator with XRE-family HTH domain